MGIYKKSSGLIFDDRFDSGSIHSRYTLSPSDAVSIDNALGQVIMPHTESDTSIMFDVPEEQTVLMEVTADYVPTELLDEGGIIIWQDGYHRLEFLESKDTTIREYSRWRALKKANKWTFYAHRGSGWEIFDTAPMVAEKMGVILKNREQTNFDTLNLDRMVVCKSDKITIGNLPTGYSVYLCDPDGNSVASAVVEPNWTGCEIELPLMPYNGIIRVYDTQGTLLSSLGAFDIYGGDIYLFGTELKVIWNGKELNKETDTYLGTMYENHILVQMLLQNPSKEKPANTISLGILKYMETFGYEWADICHDDGADTPTEEFSKLLDMGSLPPLGERKFWMKVERMEDRFQIKPLHFILDINHT
ncbi:hypothetical protein [Paenibacillus amylolyticus]|uniref:Virion structural protein n=1 Tax=Paenibacillus amylolyticus TaxID=1451 RepID=A0A100VLL2_PAEAM|nr:hypothetical protein [Paenibacillus amylolyticus]GAS82014.1 virion structural protein [Paenibacillus amylolyticus]